MPPRWEETAAHVDEWYEGAKEREVAGWGSSTEHLLLLLKVVLVAVDLNTVKKKGYTPLHALVGMDMKSDKSRCSEERGMNMLDSVRLLRKCGLDVSKSGSALHEAALEGNFGLVKGLVDAGVDVNRKNKDGWSPLACAADGGHTLIVWHLLRHGAVAAASEALHQAAAKGRSECVKLLLKARADPNEKNRHDHTAAQVLCMGENGDARGGRDSLRLLLKSGADVNVKTDIGGSLLHLIAERGNEQCIPLLLEKGLQLDSRQDDMSTPLHIACYYGQLSCAKDLIHRGASLDLVDHNGSTPLFGAVSRGHAKIVAELIRAGACVKVKDITAVTPLHMAAALGSSEDVYLLVEAGAEIDALTDTEQSPLMACMHPDEEDMSETLENFETEAGSKEDREEVATFLLKMGAAVDEKVFDLASQSGFSGVIASMFNKGREKVEDIADKLDTVAEHYSVLGGSTNKNDISQDVVYVRLVDKVSGAKGEKLYALSIPLVEQLMKKVREGGGERSPSTSDRSSPAGILSTLLDPSKRGFMGSGKGKGKSKGKRKEVELKYDGVCFTEEGFGAVVKFVTTGSVEELLTTRPGSAGKRRRGQGSSSSGGRQEMGGDDAGGSSSSSSRGGKRKERTKLFDEVRAKQALQAADFFCLETMSREVKALMSEYGFELQEETDRGGEGGEGADREGLPSRKRARTGV